jgi:hypothetical protein
VLANDIAMNDHLFSFGGWIVLANNITVDDHLGSSLYLSLLMITVWNFALQGITLQAVAVKILTSRISSFHKNTMVN